MASFNGNNSESKFPKNFRKKSERKKNENPNPVNTLYFSNPAEHYTMSPHHDTLINNAENHTELKKKRVRRRPRNHKGGSRAESESCDRNYASPVVNVSDQMFNPNSDVLSLQELYFKMKGVKVFQDPSESSPATQANKVNASPCKPKSEPTPKKKDEKRVYDKYISMEDVLIGLQNKSLLEGSLRINPRCYKQAYVSNPNKQEKDIVINGLQDRNRALEDDIVIIHLIDPVEEGKEKCGKVVHIKQRVHTQTAVGRLILNSDRKSGATFQPRDKRVPFMNIPLMDCPPFFEKEHKSYADTVFCAKIVNWVNTKYVIGTLLANVGKSDDLKTQTKAILLENDLDTQPFSSELKHLYPDADFSIPEEEFKYREDFRNCCVFTIDPLTARDLDDAVSCKTLDNGNYEIGVHISDVAYYLKENNVLDDQVAKKATTVYLVDGTYHMLPRDLCFHCSLLPGADKLCFSVIWEITPDGKIINHRFTRSIINSCCQLAYDHVQVILENPNQELIREEFPHIEGQWSLTHIKSIVQILYKLSVFLRSKRVEGGALRIDQPKLSFKLSPSNGLPINYKIEEHNESHSLIEEFMLLANCAVATRIYDDFPRLGFLRLHPPPKNTITMVADNFFKIGVDLDISSSGQLQKSIAEFSGNDVFSNARSLVLHTHLIKTLSRALYFCTNGCNDEDIRHYSLNIPLYTHFTSPIRRYADVIVHRLLAASLGYTPMPKWTPEYVQKVADNCNKQKYSAKKAGDMSSELYLMKFISLNSPLRELAAVVDVFDNSLDLIILSMGLVKRVYFDNFSYDENKVTYLKSEVEGTPNRVEVKWQGSSQFLQIFSVVTVMLEKTNDLTVINVRIVKPEEKVSQ